MPRWRRARKSVACVKANVLHTPRVCSVHSLTGFEGEGNLAGQSSMYCLFFVCCCILQEATQHAPLQLLSSREQACTACVALLVAINWQLLLNLYLGSAESLAHEVWSGSIRGVHLKLIKLQLHLFGSSLGLVH